MARVPSDLGTDEGLFLIDGIFFAGTHAAEGINKLSQASLIQALPIHGGTALKI
jgi:hypothetical protein